LEVNVGGGLSFFCGALRLPDRDQEFGLLTAEIAPSGRAAALPDRGEILAHFSRQDYTFGGHLIIVTGLR
jgi:hypothetical protein